MRNKKKKIVVNNKKHILIYLGIALAIIIFLTLTFKSLFYSNNMNSLYGQRVDSIKKHEVSKEFKNKIISITKENPNVIGTKVVVNGKIIKVITTFNDKITNTEIKDLFVKTYESFTENILSYYDVGYYSIKIVDNAQTYPVLGYKNQINKNIKWTVYE